MSWCIRYGKNVASFKTCFLIVVSGIHEKVVKSDIALPWPRSLLLGPLRRLPMLMPHGGGEGRVQRGRACMADQKGGPSWGWTGGRLGENTSWETWQVSIHFTIMKSIILKKSWDAFSFWGKKGALLYKAASLCFDPPLFELSSLAGRVSDIPDTVHSVRGEGFPRGSGALRESKLSVYGWLCKAQHGRASSGPGFTSALYWRQTFTNKEKKKKKRKMFWEKLIFFDKSIT